MSLCTMIYWKKVPENEDTGGFTDFIPLEWLSKNGTSTGLLHMVQGFWGHETWSGLAKFDMVVRGDEADLHYERYKSFNEQKGMYIGTMRIRFVGTDKRKVKEVLWKDEGSDQYQIQQVSVKLGEPAPSDAAEPPKRVKITHTRVVRDTAVTQRVKLIHQGKCQICGEGVLLVDGTRYSEAHHIHPLGGSHKGPDVAENILCVCPNHHIELDYGVRRLDLGELQRHPAHRIDQKYIDYHNLIWSLDEASARSSNIA
jgi:hypothetical protein